MSNGRSRQPPESPGSGAGSGSLAGSASGPAPGRRVVLGITGGIAAYKAAELCRLLVKGRAEVRVVMTEAATRFITPLTMQTLSGAPVATDIFDAGQEGKQTTEIGHIRLADEAELIVIAPATADAIARLAAGMANDVLAAVVLASRAPVLLAPAMNVNMWENPLTRANLGRLVGPGAAGGRFTTVGPDRGELACGWVGAGRLIEPAEIAHAAQQLLAARPPSAGTSASAPLGAATSTPGDLAGRNVVVTAGPTREPIDDVRFIGNRSSGKMGAAIAAAAAARGAHVTLLAGPGTPEVADPGVDRIEFESAAQLQAALGRAVHAADVLVMAAAVADFRPKARRAGKLSRREGDVAVSLEPVPDLLAGVARARHGSKPYLVGFAAEVPGGADLTSRAADKLREKGCDAIVANDVSKPGIGFDADENEVVVLFADGTRADVPRAAKRAVADQLWSLLVPRLGPTTAAHAARARAARHASDA
jgi:phosphopantothenoylcysteine decarboxylase/phosphopantothenate--cysteine ligase